MIDADIAVQAIKKEDGDEGIVQFGTEVVMTSDKTISSLLGAPPGTSVCLNIVLEVIHKCLPEICRSEVRRKKIKEMIPTYEINLKSIKQKEEIIRFQKWSSSAKESLRLVS